VPVSFPGHAPALLRRIVPIRIERFESGRLVGQPMPTRMGRRSLELAPIDFHEIPTGSP
jgi:hypothetical protein